MCVIKLEPSRANDKFKCPLNVYHILLIFRAHDEQRLSVSGEIKQILLALKLTLARGKRRQRSSHPFNKHLPFISNSRRMQAKKCARFVQIIVEEKKVDSVKEQVS